jgi:hypothetical protein
MYSRWGSEHGGTSPWLTAKIGTSAEIRWNATEYWHEKLRIPWRLVCSTDIVLDLEAELEGSPQNVSLVAA